MGIYPTIIKVTEELKDTLLTTHDEGLALYKIMAECDPRNLYLDFSNVERTSFAFLNASIGKFIMDKHTSGPNLIVQSIPNKTMIDKIKLVMNNANKNQIFDITTKNDKLIQLRYNSSNIQFLLPKITLDDQKQLIGDCIEYLEVLDHTDSFYKKQIIKILKDSVR